MDWVKLTSETPGVLRDENGVPIEWTLLKKGKNPFCQEGQDGAIAFSGEHLAAIMDYYNKKGEEIPIDSEHWLARRPGRTSERSSALVPSISTAIPSRSAS